MCFYGLYTLYHDTPYHAKNAIAFAMVYVMYSFGHVGQLVFCHLMPCLSQKTMLMDEEDEEDEEDEDEDEEGEGAGAGAGYVCG